MGFSLRVPPIPHSHTVQPLWAVINCYCQWHNQEQGEKKTPALIMSSTTRPTYTHTVRNTQKMHNTHQENGCYYWFLGWCARRCTNTEAWLQEVFFCLSRAIIVLQHPTNTRPMTDSKSIQLWNRQKCCIALIFSLIRATPVCMTFYRAQSGFESA